MEKPRTKWSRLRAFGRRYAFLFTIIGAVIGTSIALYQVYYFEPPANVGLEFDGSVLGYMRPDFGLESDLKAMGFKNRSNKTIGMSYFDMVLGWVHNRGNKDAEDVEIKVPVDGTLSFQQVSGFPDNPNVLSNGDAVVVPEQYVRIGNLRADDPPFLLTLYCTTGQLNHITFRYKQGSTTKTVKYLVKKDPKTQHIRIVRTVLWGMDSVELKEFVIECAYWIAGALVVVVILYWFWKPITFKLRSYIAAVFNAIGSMFKAIGKKIDGNANTPTGVNQSNTTPAKPAAKLTKQQKKQRLKDERRRGRRQ